MATPDQPAPEGTAIRLQEDPTTDGVPAFVPEAARAQIRARRKREKQAAQPKRKLAPKKKAEAAPPPPTEPVIDPSLSPEQRIEAWFNSRGWAPFPFQQDLWQAYGQGKSGLLHSSTGTGKSYAVWFAALREALQEEATSTKTPLRVLWLTPLRALAGDITAALQDPLAPLGLDWEVVARTGDTSARTRAKLRDRLPPALVTTPESLSLMLSQPKLVGEPNAFSELRLIVVDEWHELLVSKRGVMVQLALARLRKLCPGLRVWGLSATLGNLPQAQKALLGEKSKGVLVRGKQPKTFEIATLLPPEGDRFPWGGHLGIAMLDRVLAAIESARTTLLFTNTRSQAELWFRALTEARPDLKDRIALHHGSLDPEEREQAERGLKEGTLLAVVSTSSLDLGVDFAPVDQVLQVGSPKGVARLLQRAGRSGHQPGAVSRILCVPTNTFELVENCAVRDLALAGKIESIHPIDCPLDLLIQHLLTVAAGTGFEPDALFAEVRTAHAYRDLTREEFDWALDFAARGGSALKAYENFRRLTPDEVGAYRFANPRALKQHRMSIGTITSDQAVAVRYLNGARLGQVEESFVSKMKTGDRFVFAGKTLELARVRDMTAWVRNAKRKSGAVPRWMGGKMPLTTALAAGVMDRLDQAKRGVFDAPEMQAVQDILEIQRRVSLIPGKKDFLIETAKSREGHHAFVYSFGGRLVHEGLSALAAYRISRHKKLSFTIACNDYGFELLAPEPIPLEEALEAGLFSLENLTDDVLASLNAAEMAKRRFREIARIAGLTFQGYPGAWRTAKQLQMSSSLLFEVFTQYDPENLLLTQAQREVLNQQLERTRLVATLEAMAKRTLRLIPTGRLSPLAFPLYVERLRESMSNEKLADRVRHMEIDLEKVAAT